MYATMRPSPQRKRLWFDWGVVPAGLCLVALSGLWWNYLVFHTLAETVSILVGMMALTVALAAFPLSRNHFLTFIGIALGWCAVLDVLHTFAYKGMGTFLFDGKEDVSLAPELWVGARLLQAASLLAAPWFLLRPLSVWRAQAVFAAYVGAMAFLIFTHRLPAAFVEGQGQTPFKIGAEYLIIAMLAAALVQVRRHRALMSSRMATGITVAIVAVILSEFAFTLYVDQYAASNAIGHLLKIVASWFFFAALVRDTLREPFAALGRAAGTYDAVPSPALVADPQGRVMQANRAALALAGRDLREVAGRPVHEVFHDPAVAVADCPVCRRLASGETRFREELRLGGRVFDCSVAPYIDGRGAGMRVELLADVTETRARTERIAFEARRVEALLRLTQLPSDIREMDFMQAGQEMAEALTGSRIAFIHLVNEDQETIELVAWSKATLAHYCKASVDRHYPISRAGIWADAFRKRAPVVVNDYASATGKKGLPEGHAELRRLISVPVIEGGKVRMMTGVGNKDTEYTETDVETVRLISDAIWRTVRQRRSEAELGASESRLRALLNAIPDPVWMKDAAGRYLACNAAFERLYGAPEARILDRTDHDFVAPDQANFFREHDRAALAAEAPLTNEEWLTYATDRRRFLSETTKVAVRDKEGLAMGVLGMARDVTEARRFASEREDLVRALNERVKELRCLHDISLLLESAGDDVAGALEGIVQRLPAGFQHPERVEVRIAGALGVRGAAEARGAGLERVLRLDGQGSAVLRVQYPGEHRAAEEVFLPEESALLDNVAARANGWLEARSAETRFTRVFHASPAPMLLVSVADNRVRSVNQACLRWLGYAQEDGGSIEKWLALVYPDPVKRAELVAHWAQSVATSTRTGLPVRSPEIRLRRRDGRELVAQGEMTVIGEDAIVVWQDLTEIREGEEALRESEHRFRSMIEAAQAGIYVRRDGRFVYANPSFGKMLGYRPEELLGRDVLDFTTADAGNLASIREAWSRLADGAPEVSYGVPMRRSDGRMIDTELHARNIDWSGGPAVIVMVDDVTERRRAERSIQQYIVQLRGAMRGTLEVVTRMVDLRDPYTAGHERRVGRIARELALEMGWSAERAEALELIGLVHDVGKIAVPTEILTKPGRLSPLEMEIVRSHAEAGFDILKEVPFSSPVAETVRQHHERMDGSGYPRGLKGEEILPEARILAVADVVESMASHRPYRPALGLDPALAEIERGRGAIYDADVADACLRLMRKPGYALPA